MILLLELNKVSVAFFSASEGCIASTCVSIFCDVLQFATRVLNSHSFCDIYFFNAISNPTQIKYAQTQSEEQGPHLNLQLMNTVMRAAELDYIIQNEVDCDRDDNFDDGTEFMCVDNNVAIFKEEDGICFVGYRGTQIDDIRDWADDANPGWSDVCNNQGECCLCRDGFVHSFK